MSKERPTPFPEPEVYAVILAYGQERSGVLSEVLRVLHIPTGTSAKRGSRRVSSLEALYQPSFTVSHAWVRAVGPIGVVMMRFKAKESIYRAIVRRAIDWPGPDEKRSTTQLKIIVHRDEKPWSADARIHSAAVVAEWPKDDRWEKAYDVFVDVLNNLGADEKIDVAEQDWVETTDRAAPTEPNANPEPSHRTLQVSASLRLFDLGRRGVGFLPAAIAAAISAAGDHEFTYLALEDTPLHGGVAKKSPIYLRNALRGPKEQTRGPGKRVYIFIHALDSRGLLATVTDIVRKDKSTIHRSCCRGLGRDGLVVMEATLAGSRSPAEVESDLRRELPKFFRRTIGSARLNESAAEGVPSTGVWTISVFKKSNPSPALGGSGRSETVELKILSIDDGPGLLLSVSDAIDAVNKHVERGCPKEWTLTGGISIYFLDGQLKSLGVGKSDGTRQFEFGVGLKVPKYSSNNGKGMSLEEFVKQVWLTLERTWRRRKPRPDGPQLPSEIEFIPPSLRSHREWMPTRIKPVKRRMRSRH